MEIQSIIPWLSPTIVLLGILYTAYLHRQQNKENTNVKIGKIEAGIDKLDDGQQKLDSRIDKLDTKIDGVSKDLIDFKERAFSTFVTKKDAGIIVNNSPPELTERGIKLAEDSGIDNLISLNIEVYYKQLDEVIGVAAVFEKCLEIANTELQKESDIVQNMKDYFYNEGVDFEVVKRIFAIRLRDQYNSKKTNLK